MDVGELLSFQPEKPTLSYEAKQKRSKVDEDDDRGRRKRRRPDAGGLEEPFSNGQMTEEEKDKIKKMVEAEPDAELMDETSFKKMLLQFEKRVYKNQENRIKFPDLPEKFLESEIELNEIIHEMHVMATVPEYYQILVDLRCVQSLLQLVAHDNTDISIAVIDLIQELTDPDILSENEDTASVLVDALLDGQVVAVLVNNLDRLDENIKEEFEGVHNSLAIIENMTEFKPDVCADIAQQGLMQWLLKRLRMKRPFDQNKLYCSEILSILLQDTEENRQLLGELEGIDILLQQLATFKKHDPSSKDEMELMENLFDAMCSALAFAPNRSRFLRGEGLQLMNLMLREKKLSRNSAVKVLNHAMTGIEGQDNCQKFVEILGLRSVFPLYMKTPKTAKTGPTSDELEEHISSIIASMMRNCQGTLRQRLLLKFTENDHEKVERLLELHFKYLDKVRQCDDQIEREKMRLKHSGEDLDEDMEDEFYLKRLDAGLFTLQLIDYIMLEACASGASSIRSRVMQILNMRGGSIKVIRGVMREYAGNIGDAKDKVAREAEQDRILALVDKF
ncbi:beta-catenin-like protein 1 [Plakobranchus ocellatus]|uniref:Beta-catenin-like protein 1 n=1 Tax=Plakobranchus ocellatus TaxID=259542 RepID=A0AAV3Z9B7_9GAST|nr:beta-catenin-like protein 1 [Plakobranchus ocellatus]